MSFSQASVHESYCFFFSEQGEVMHLYMHVKSVIDKM